MRQPGRVNAEGREGERLRSGPLCFSPVIFLRIIMDCCQMEGKGGDRLDGLFVQCGTCSSETRIPLAEVRRMLDEAELGNRYLEMCERMRAPMFAESEIPALVSGVLGWLREKRLIETIKTQGKWKEELLG